MNVGSLSSQNRWFLETISGIRAIGGELVMMLPDSLDLAPPIWKVPTALTPLLGREQEVVVLCELLARPGARLLTLVGPGGIGKTRLVMQIATELRAHFAQGVCFVSLAPLSDPELILP